MIKGLEIYPTQDLIEELTTRYEHYVLIGQCKGIKQKVDVVTKIWSGDILICLGYLGVAHDFLMEDYQITYRDKVGDNDI